MIRNSLKKAALAVAFVGAFAFASFGTTTDAEARGCYRSYGGGHHHHVGYGGGGYGGYYAPRSYYVASPVVYGYGRPSVHYRSGGYGYGYGGRGFSFGFGF